MIDGVEVNKLERKSNEKIEGQNGKNMVQFTESKIKELSFTIKD